MSKNFNLELIKLISKEIGLKEECLITEITIESKPGQTRFELTFELIDKPGGPR